MGKNDLRGFVMKEIMLNKSFAGSWGLDSEENIPHEIINLFKSDNGNIYLYVPPYGGYNTREHPNIEYILLTGQWTNNETEILYVAKGLQRLHEGGRFAKLAERETLKKYIEGYDIKYGGKYLHEIKMSETEESKIFYLTFQVDNILKPARKLFLTWGSGNDFHSEKCDKIFLKKPYKYQRQTGFIQEDNLTIDSDYSKIEKIINDATYWDSTNVPQKIDISSRVVSADFNFLNLIHKEYDENSYTNMFYEFFNANTQFFNEFAKDVLKLPEDDVYVISKEITTTDRQGRIDLLAVGNKYVIGIENKIKSGLNGLDKNNKLSQLTTYIKFIENKYPSKEHRYFLFEPNYNDIDIAKFDSTRGSEFIKVQYSLIYEYMKSHIGDLKSGRFFKYADDFVAALQIHTLTMKDVVEQRFLYAINNS